MPSWAVDPASQLGWKSTSVASLTDLELDLVRDVIKAPEVLAGRSINVRGRGMLVLDDWLKGRGVLWTQRWQDVYNKSLYLRTASGSPVKVMAGAGYSAAEAAAAEEGAALSRIKNVNVPYWPDATPPTRVGPTAPTAEPPVVKPTPTIPGTTVETLAPARWQTTSFGI